MSGGKNIYPDDVERMLEGHPLNAQACVVPVDHAIKGAKPGGQRDFRNRSTVARLATH